MSSPGICDRGFVQSEGLRIEPSEIGDGLAQVADLEETDAGESRGSCSDTRRGIPQSNAAECEYGHAGAGGDLARANVLQRIHAEWHDVRSHFFKYRSEDGKVCAVGFRFGNLFCIVA